MRAGIADESHRVYHLAMDEIEPRGQDVVHVIVKVFGALRDVHRASEQSVALGADRTIRDLLAILRESNQELVQKLEVGLADGYLSCLVNGRNVNFLDGLDTALAEGTTIAFLPPVGGG